MDKNKKIDVQTITNMIEDFYTNRIVEDAIIIEDAIFQLIERTCDIFEMNRSIVVVQHTKQDTYLKLYEWLKTYESDSNGTIVCQKAHETHMEECIDIFCNERDEYQKRFLDSCGEKGYIYSRSYADLEEQLKSIGYESSNIKEIKECYIFSIQYEGLFGYICFENHKELMWSEQDIEILTMLCRTVSFQIEKICMRNKYETYLLMDKIILDYEKIPMVVVEKDTFKILYYNELYHEIFPEIELGKMCSSLFRNEHKCAEEDVLMEVLMNDLERKHHQWIKRAILFELEQGKEAYMIYLKDSSDYTSQINAMDKLTGALLFRGFEEYYKNFIQRSVDQYALCTLDIDKLKYINNVFGYEVGDDVLQKVSWVIDNFIEKEENFCRMGEDKFSVFLRYDDDVQLRLKIRELAMLFQNMRDDHFTDTRITIIGGVTVVDKSLDINTLLDQSTIARKSAKGSHKNNFSYYNPELDVKVKKEIEIEEQIPHALANDEFVPYLQPKFDLHTKKICGAEALVRWITPKGMIFPDQFIPLFEKNGFILTLDFIIYDKVMRYIRKCLDEGLPVYPISVNVSRNHIKDKNFLSKFMELIEKYHIPNQYLELEVTESVFIEDKLKLKQFIDSIKEYKLKVSIDDFGTAYSSLQILTDINVDILKIDKGFLDNINLSDKNIVTKDEILIKNIINLAKELDFKVICEGVETDEQIQLLKKVGCELGQGYVFAKPMSIADYEKQFLL